MEFRKPVFLVINADDFGYFASVSRGVIECVRRKAITATGIMANGPRFKETIEWLREFPELDIGVHLNITYGLPLTSGMKACLSCYEKKFQDRMRTARLILCKKLPVSTVIEEWRAQIKKCLSNGLRIRFINSHEHIHMLPPLFKPFVELTREFNVPYFRYTQPERPTTLDIKPFFRNLILVLLVLLNRRFKTNNCIRLIGSGMSCKLSLGHLEMCFKKLKGGQTYELMCHPGYYDKKEIEDLNLVRYHSWEEELRLLTGEPMERLLQKYNVKRSRFGGITS